MTLTALILKKKGMIRHITTKIEKTIKMEIRKLIINQSGRTKGKSTKIAQINSHYL